MPISPVPRPALGAPRAPRLPRPSWFWVAAVVLSAVTGLTAARLLGRASAEAARWGELRPTLVAVAELEPGSTVASGDAVVEHRPVALVPAGALDAPAEGRTVAATIHPGEPVLAERLAPAGLSATAALLPAGHVGIAVPTGPDALPLEPGDTVEVLATFAPGGVGVPGAAPAGVRGDEPTFPVARSAPVAAVGEESVTLAVTEDEAPRVAFALTAGVVTLALSAGR